MPFTDNIKQVEVIMEENSAITATPSDVLIGKKFIGSTKHIESGIVPVNDEREDIILEPGETCGIPNGVNPSSYNVTAKDLESETPGDATEYDLLKNKVAWANGERIVGTIDSIESNTVELACGESVFIDRGFHDGTGKIIAKDLFSQTFANVIPDYVLVGNTCWANGELVEGTMPNNGAINKVLSAGAIYSIPKGYHNGNGKITVNEIGTLTPATAEPRYLVEGYTAWVDGELITGIMPANTPEEIILPMNGIYYIPNGYHTGEGKIIQNIPSKEGQTIAPSKEAQVIEVAGYCMEGNITVSGVDALNYQRPNTYVKDIYGEDISNYTLSVFDNEASIKVYVDNWHDNSTLNVYEATFINLVDKNGNAVDLKCNLFIDWTNPTSSYKFNDIEIEVGLEDGTNSHVITIKNIGAGNISLVEKFSSREFGVNE